MSAQLVVRIPEEQKLMLEIMAAGRQGSVAEITREAIDYYVKKHREEKGLLARLAKIGEEKQSASGPRDLSDKYKKYLY